MGYLNSDTIKALVSEGAVGISPYIEKYQGPNMYYCHLGDKLLIPKKGLLADTRNLSDSLFEEYWIEDYYDLKPGEFILAELYEVLKTDKSHIIRLFNSSSLARLGVVQCAVGMVNPGCGSKKPLRITLELSNVGSFTVRLYPSRIIGEEFFPGTEVLKIAVATHETVPLEYENWSGALYGNDTLVTASKIDRRYV